MNCRKARKWISLDMDGELSVRRKEVLYNHIRRCERCSVVRDRWLSLGDRLRERVSGPGQTAEAAWADVRRAIRSAADQKEPIWWPSPGAVLRWATLAASAAALCAVAVLGVRWWAGKGVPLMAREAASSVEWVESGLPDASTMVYEDQESGMVVIWVVEQNGGAHVGT